jgi:hypothetical protein
VPDLRDFLSRFRPAGAPGAAREDAARRVLAAAQHEVAGTLLWDLRVPAGWLPRDGVRLLRTLGGWFEIAHVDELLQSIAGRPAPSSGSAPGSSWRKQPGCGALRAVEAEALATRYRLRAVRNRWIPRLEQALARRDPRPGGAGARRLRPAAPVRAMASGARWRRGVSSRA